MTSLQISLSLSTHKPTTFGGFTRGREGIAVTSQVFGEERVLSLSLGY